MEQQFNRLEIITVKRLFYV